MKKLILIIAVSTFTLFSCKKVYECECDYIHTSTGPNTEVFKIEAFTKSSAKEYCEEGAGIYTENPNCRLK